MGSSPPQMADIGMVGRADASGGQPERILGSGAVGYIIKPVDVVEALVSSTDCSPEAL